MKSRVIGLFAAMACSVGLTVHGQWQDPMPQTPEAATLSKYLNYPVSHYTGIADISVPLFSVKSGQLTLPFTLRYHSGGFKINEREGIAGLGWSISPTLQISRSIRGFDDLATPGNPGAHTNGYASNPFCAGPNGDAMMREHTADGYQMRYKAYKRNQDHEPDVFNYTLLNKSGSFYFQKDANGTVNIVPSPYNGVKVEHWSGGFIITDTDGTVYRFYNVEEKTARQGTEPEHWNTIAPVTTWKCLQIVGPNKRDLITFHYRDKAPIYSYSFSKSVKVYESECDLSSFSNNLNQLMAANIPPAYTDYQQVKNMVNVSNALVREPSPKIVFTGYDSSQSDVYFPYLDTNGDVVNRHFNYNILGFNASVTEIRSKTLDYITFNGGRVDFEYAPGSDQISKLTLNATQGGKINEVVFNQSLSGTLPTYTNGTEGFKENYTWYLDSISINGLDYGFAYHGSKPHYSNYSFGSDMWGYPNWRTTSGFSSQYSFLPKVKHLGKLYGLGCSNNDNKEVSIGTGGVFAQDANLLKVGVLRKITYPTKGYTKFDYENNYANANAIGSCYGPTVVGGLRIASIKNYDYNHQLKSQKRYVYGDNQVGTGFSRGVIPDCMYGYDILQVGNPDVDERLKLPDIFKYTTTVKHFKYGHGINELPMHPHETGTVGYGTWYDEKVTTWLPHPRYDINFADGTPIYYKVVTEYDNEDTTIAPVGKTVYRFQDTYGFGQESSQTTLSAMRNAWQMGKLESITEMRSRYVGIGFAHDTVRHRTYKYREKLHDKKVYYGQMFATVTPAGLPQVLEYKGYEIAYVYKSMDIGNKLLEKETETLYHDTGKVKKETDYDYDGYGQLKSTTTRTSLGRTLVTNVKRAKDFANDAVAANLVSNNMLALPIESTTTLNGTPIEGHKNVYYADGTGQLRESHELYPTGFERKASYSYSDGRPVSMTLEDGVPVAYIWGYGQEYPIAKVENATYGQVLGHALNLQSKSNADNDRTIGPLGKEGELRTAQAALRGSLPNAMVTTYTYDPLVGVTSITDPRGHTTYYEYDDFNRLEHVKDADGNLLSENKYNYKN